MHGMKIQLQVAHTMAVGLSIYVIYALRMWGCKTKATKALIALITFTTDQPGHKGPPPAANQPLKYWKEMIQSAVIIQVILVNRQ